MSSTPETVVISGSALPSGGSTSAKQDTGNTSLSSIDTKLLQQPTLSRAVISGNTNGSNVVVAAVAAQVVKVYAILVVFAADVDITVKSTAGTALSGAMSMGTKGNGFVLPEGHNPWFVTAAGTGLDLVLNGAVQMSGVVLYTQS